MKGLVETALGLVASLLLITTAAAQPKSDPENLCQSGGFPLDSDDYRAAKVKGTRGEKIYFHDDSKASCPADRSCRLKAYVIPGDQVIVAHTLGKFACSLFQPLKSSETTGWIEIDRLEWVDTKRPPGERDWFGEWRLFDNVIRISKGKTPGELKISGEAYWGSGDRVNTGDIGADAKPSGDKLSFKDAPGEGSCEVGMRLVGKLLAVMDNNNCGGNNVSFSGIYQKSTKR
jgi:hypothetical protein